MRLHSPRFEKALRRGVKKAVRSSRELKREFRQAKKFRRSSNILGFYRFFFSVVLVFVVWGITSATGHPATGLAALSLWTFAWIFFHSQSLWSCLNTATDLPALTLLPVAESAIFRWELQKFLRKAFFSLLDLAAGFGVLALLLNFSPAKWLALIPITALSWLTLLSLAAFCAARLPRPVRQMIITGIVLSGLSLVFIAGPMGKVFLACLDRCAPELNLWLPTGWAISQFELLLPGSRWTNLYLLVPVAAIIWTLGSSLKRLKSGFHFEEKTQPVAADLIPGSEMDGPVAAIHSKQMPPHLGLTAIEEIVQTRQFFSPAAWPHYGWFEQQLWRWLNAREKTLGEFVFPKGCKITASWKVAVRNLCVAVAASFAVGWFSPAGKVWILGIGLFISFCHAWGQIVWSGAAFHSMFSSGVRIPFHAGFPIGYRELSRLLFKYSAVQLPLFIPFIMICGVLGAHLAAIPITGKIIITAFKAAILLFATRFILVTFAFSSITNDSTRFQFRTWALVSVMVLLGLLFLLFGGAGLFVPYPLAAWALLLLAVLDAWGFFRAYGWFYHANHFDLMSLPRQ